MGGKGESRNRTTEGVEMIVTLPFPDARLNPNRANGRHWAGTANIKKIARNEAAWLTKQAMREWAFDSAALRAMQAGGSIPLMVTFSQPDRRYRDRDNLLASIKSSLDGVAGALGVNDSQFDPVTIRREYGTKPGATIIKVGA